MSMKNKTQKKKKSKQSMFLLRMGINRDEIDYFIDNLSMLINSGMDIVAALNAIKTDIRSKSMVKLIDYMKEEID